MNLISYFQKNNGKINTFTMRIKNIKTLINVHLACYTQTYELYRLRISLHISQMLLTGIRKAYIPTRGDGQHVSILFFTENKKTLFKIHNKAIRLQNVVFFHCVCVFR